MCTTIRKEVEVEVDVSLDDFSNDDIRREFELREHLSNWDEIWNQVQGIQALAGEMFNAFYLGKKDQAIQLAEQIAQDATGRVLPTCVSSF